MNRLTRWALPALAALPLALTACGGLSHPASAPVIKPPVNTPKAAVVTAKVVDRHVCDKRDYNLACPLPIASVATIVRGVDPTTQGVDFGWSCPVAAARNFGASYLSYDTSKDWTPSCVHLFHSQGKGTVAVWEAGANDATRGFNLGYSQAKRAASELATLGAPAKQPFDMAVDCDCAGSSLVSYFQGANAAEPGRVNAYGGYFQVSYLFAHHLVGHLNWQTYAWSGGRWLPATVAPLEQYLNSSAVDYDRAIAANFGQWPAPASIAVRPHVRLICFGHRARLRNRTCKKVRAEVAKWSKAEASSRRALRAAERGLTVHRCHRPYRRDICVDLGRETAPVLRHRVRYFAAKVKATRKQYS